MKLTDFGAYISTPQFLQQTVLILSSKHYNPLLLKKVVAALQKKHDCDVKKIDIDQSIDEIALPLQTTFLGQKCIFWFSDVTQLTSKKRKSDWLHFLQTYNGPHVIVGCLPDDEQIPLQQGVMFEVQDNYQSDQISKISLLYDDQKPEIAAFFIGKLYRYRKEYSLQQICMLLEYASVLGKNTDLFFEQWLDQLIVSDVSLYYLSQLFFEKNTAQFFDTWSYIRPLYPDQFWTSFFSEQLFKAYWYVVWQGRIAPEHKTMSYGLAFSFLKNDWKLYKPATLLTAHQHMYEVDLALKSGSYPTRLDLFLVQFFKGF
ncbi:hypothetical protein KBD08_03825 [Candidatus Babeliales bacterium]|nr:hypothetical protein [Candidatus Babeliales bacterium]